jgi:inosose dehydratase
VIRVGTAPVNWGVDPEYTWIEQRPYREILDEMRLAGYDATEWAYTFPSDPDELRRELAARKMALASSFCSVDFLGAYDPEPALKVCRLLTCLGSRDLLVAQRGTPERYAKAGRIEASDGLSDGDWRRLAANLHDLAERARGLGASLAFHNHAGTAVETAPELERLCAETDPSLVRLCLDTGHLAYGGADPVAFAGSHRERLGYVHLKDVDAARLQQAREQRLSFLEAVRSGIFVELGHGVLDLPAFIATLREVRYAGWLVVEQDSTTRSPLESARMNRQYLKEKFGL